LIAACSGDNYGSPTGPLSSQRRLVSVDEVAAAPEKFLDESLRVQGQIHVEEEFSRRPCTAPNPADCGPEVLSAQLLLVTPGKPAGSAATLRLVRSRGDGKYEPISCVRRASGGYDCGDLVHGTVVTLDATLVKRLVTTGSITEPDGTVIPIQQATQYVLAVN
jgi:hypothetical protein